MQDMGANVLFERLFKGEALFVDRAAPLQLPATP